tara:strand:+ start:159 stop:404 length:246 start_codon:yes stop_codon:yes gene_type:complete
MDEYIFVSIFIIVIGSLIVKQRESLREIIEEFVATQQEKEDVIEVEEIRDLIFDFVVKNSEKLSKCKYNEPQGQSGIEKMS